MAATDSPPGLAYFSVAGGCMAVGLGCLFAALMVGTVTVVAPIVAAYPVVTLLVSASLGDERISGKLLAGVALVVVGVAAISASVD